MSNKVVSSTYRTIIDDVIANVRQDFEDMGIEKEVLEELQRSWEAKIVATGVTEFDGAEPVPQRGRKGKGAEASTSAAAAAAASTSASAVASGSGSGSSSNKAARTNGAADASASRDASGGSGIAKKEGSAEDDEDGKDVKTGEKRKRPVPDDDAIGSDLDDSEEEDEDGGIDDGDMDGLILCLYEKVQRVRNRWRVLLRDGVISLNGRDYLFGKLSGELEW